MCKPNLAPSKQCANPIKPYVNFFSPYANLQISVIPKSFANS